MSKRVAVVTGSNKGIGLAIVEALCKDFGGDVLLTARDRERGEAARRDLQCRGLKTTFHQLDIADDSSIQTLVEFVTGQYNGVDVLVNNAAVAFLEHSQESLSSKAEKTMTTNFFGTLKVCHALFPLLKPSARVVHVASALGHLKRLKSPALEERFQAPSLTEDMLIQMAHEYIKGEGEKDSPWPVDSAYSVSKVFVIALCRIQARTLATERPDDDICVNCCCPGFVDTDLNGHRGHLTTAQGADTPVLLAMLDAASPTGQFYKRRTVCQW